MELVRKLFAKPALTAAAVIFGAFVVFADVVLFAALLGRKPDFSEPVVLVNGILAAAPFLWLAYRGSTRLLPWLIGIALTLWLWWSSVQNGVAYQRAPDGSGVDFTFPFLILFSPALIGGLCVWVDVLMRGRPLRT